MPSVNRLLRPYNAWNRYNFPLNMQGCVLYVPLWQEDMRGSTFLSYDQYHHVGTPTTPTAGPKGRTFNGTSDIITIPDATCLQDLGTVSYLAWIYPTGWGEANFGRILAKFTAVGRILFLGGVTQAAYFYITFTGVDGQWKTADSSIALNTWQCIGVTYNSGDVGNNPIFYLQGAPVAVTLQDTPVGTVDSDVGLNLSIGNTLDTGTTFAGIIGEVWAFNRILSGPEMAYATQVTKGPYV